jgi:sugar lactone lactonase YvrE
VTVPVPITPPSYTLAEGPVWDAARRRLLWLDIEEGLVLVGRLEGDQVVLEKEHRFESYVGALALAEDGSILVAETRTLTRVAPDGTRTSTVDVEQLGPGDRFNDGLCDAEGRLLVGTCSFQGIRDSQLLLRIDADGTKVLDEGLGLSNGLAFSPDAGTLYSVDSVPGGLWRRTYDQSTGSAGMRELLVDLDGFTPDGLAVDATGRLWLAVWGRGEVRCYSPDGEHLDTIAVPAPHVSCVAFVGDDLDRLVITTARSELTEEQLAEFPLSGSLFLADPGCTGLAPFAWPGRLDTPTRRTS